MQTLNQYQIVRDQSEMQCELISGLKQEFMFYLDVDNTLLIDERSLMSRRASRSLDLLTHSYFKSLAILNVHANNGADVSFVTLTKKHFTLF